MTLNDAGGVPTAMEPKKLESDCWFVILLDVSGGSHDL
jgi:hypothetical protein